MQTPQARMLPDGKRLHLNHGPIDLIIEAFGEQHEIKAAYAQAVARFQTVLTELVAELPMLRCAVDTSGEGVGLAFDAAIRTGNVAELGRLRGDIARRMFAAVLPHAENFITPMAAVAGSVADEIVAAMVAERRLDKAYVNNGGDIALYFLPCVEGRSTDLREPQLSIAIARTGHGFDGRTTIRASDPVRGIATSGWRGRSFSLGIADAVTVLAQDAAQADAAATVIANAVDLPGHAEISRKPANEISPDSDLGERLVTVDVGMLRGDEVASALESGLLVAADLKRRGLIDSAALFLAGQSRVCGDFRTPSTGRIGADDESMQRRDNTGTSIYPQSPAKNSRSFVAEIAHASAQDRPYG